MKSHLQLLLVFMCCSLILCSCSSTGTKRVKTTGEIQTEEIKKVVDYDQELRRQVIQSFKEIDPRTHQTAVAQHLAAAQIYTQYAQQLRSLDMNRCPLDFQIAYLEYIHQLEGLAAQLSKKPEGPGLGDLIGLLGTVANPITGITVFLAKDITRVSQEKSAIEKAIEAEAMKVQESRRKIELIALQHGVRFQETQK